jgi:hypothetical protein
LVALFVTFAAGCADDPDGGDGGVADGGVVDAGSDVESEVDASDPSDPPPIDQDAGRDAGDTTSTTWDLGIPDDDVEPEMFTLDRVVPPSGPVEGGNRVRIVGENLDGEMQVFFGSREADFRLSGGALVGPAPEASRPGTVAVKVIDEDGETRSLPKAYEYVSELSVNEITPSRVPTDGGVAVRIRGEGFSDPTAVSFAGNSALDVERLDETLLRVAVPPGQPGPADVRLTNSNESLVVDEGLKYFDELAIGRVSPAAGSTAGGETVTLEVAGLGSEADVYFGNDPAMVRDVDPRVGEVEVETPPHASGLVDVSVESAGDATLRADTFLYSDDDGPRIAAIHPDHGSTAGGTEVTIVGRGLDVASPSFRFGEREATNLSVDSTVVRVETPVGTAGTVDVALTSSGSEVARATSAFEYRRALELMSASPGSGPASGGTEVTLEGTGFTDVERVQFGGLPAEFEVVSDERLRATAPPHTPGRVDVTVERDGMEARLEEAFTYTTDLEIWGFGPARGSIAGGTYVEVRGKGFVGRVEAKLDGTEAQEVRRIDRNNIYLYTPPHPEGDAELTVGAGEQTASGPYRYEYFNPASRYGGVSGGRVDGAVNVTVLAQGGGPLSGAFVMLSPRADTPYTGTTDANGQITLSGPDIMGPQTVTATAKGFSSATVRSVNAENVTVFLRKMNPENGSGGGGGGGPPVGVIRGEVEAPSKMADPGDRKTYDVAFVRTTQSEIRSQTPDPGEGSVVVEGGEYEIKSRIGDLAVVAQCGVYDEERQEFEPRYIGVNRYVTVSDGGEYEADISCDVPLDQSLEVKIQNPIFSPSGPDTNVARVYWDFGFEGVFPSPTNARGMDSLLMVEDQPALDGKLSDVTFSVVGGSFTGSGSPSSQTQVHDVADVSTRVQLPPLIDVPEPIEPRPGGELDGREIRFQTAGPYYPDMYSIYLLNRQGRPFWRYFMSGESTSITLPDFPDLSFLPADQRPEPITSGRAFVLIVGIDSREVTFDNFTYQDLSFSNWRGYATTRWGFDIP